MLLIGATPSIRRVHHTGEARQILSHVSIECGTCPWLAYAGAWTKLTTNRDVMAANKTVRWINLVKVLRDAIGGLSAAEIKSSLDDTPGVVAVDLRTIQRDLIELDQSGLVGLERLTRDGREVWRMDRTFTGFTGDRVLSGTAALTLKMAMDYAAVLLPVAAREHLLAQANRVQSVLRSEGLGGQIAWTEKVRVLPSGFQLTEPAVDPSVIRVVYESLARETMLRCRCKHPGRTDEFEGLYSPLALVYRSPRMSLVVSTCAKSQPQVLELHRIKHATATDSPIERPTGFALDRFIADGHLDSWQGEPIRLRLKCNRELADNWRSTALGAEQVISGTKSAPIVEATCPHTAALETYLLGLGTQIEILGPYRLREWMVFKAAELASVYAHLFPDESAP